MIALLMTTRMRLNVFCVWMESTIDASNRSEYIQRTGSLFLVRLITVLPALAMSAAKRLVIPISA
jgi:hypothetical protein